MATSNPLSAFAGRIISSLHDIMPTDVVGPHTVMYPTSDADIATAMALSHSARRPVILRSGTHAITRDVVDGTGAVVINLHRMRKVTVTGTRVVVCPATTVSMLVDALLENDLFLPVPENRLQSVVAAVLSGDPGCLSRSAGLLKEYLDTLTILRHDGSTVKVHHGDELFDDVLEQRNGNVITCLEFNALSHKQAEGFWVSQLAFPFSQKIFHRLNRFAFSRLSLPDTVDIAVKAVTTVLGHPLIMCSIAGDAEEDSSRERIIAAIKRYLTSVDQNIAVVPDAPVAASDAPATPADAPEIPHSTFYGKDIVRAVFESGELSGFSNGHASSKHVREVKRGDLATFVNNYSRIVSYALGPRSNGEIHLLGVSLSTRLVLTEDRIVKVITYFFSPKEMSPAQARLYRMLNNIVPRVLTKLPLVAREAEVPLEDFDLPLEVREAPDWRVADAKDPKFLASILPPSLIPGFGGPIYTEEDGDIYDENAKQYASSSYPNELKPFMVAYPMDIDDIRAAIKYATENKKNIVARSGGHQYSGLSSGGSSTIVLSMDKHFNTVGVVGNRATVGVGAKLTDLAEIFNNEGVTIPHGECPLVCIGGHAQSGGYGHLLRSFGLALDYVISFDIVTGDGRFQTVHRQRTEEKGLFWAVLGGGPSSFGVLTSVTFEAIRDSDHPFSRGHGSVRTFLKPVFRAAMETVRDFTIAIESKDKKLPDGTTLPDDLDMMCTAISTDFFIRPPLLRGLILLEMVHGNVAGSDGEAASLHAQTVIDKVADRLQDAVFLPNPTLVQFKGPKPLSFMSNEFVRREGTTPDGREFKYPYEKRLNATNHALSKGFVTGFVDLVDETINDPDVRLVFQMGLGGGAYRNIDQRRLSSCSRRDAAFAVVYDVFYTKGHKDRAVELQDKMKKLLEREFPEKDGMRMFWGTFGDTKIETAWPYYLDNEDVYKQLQAVKAEVDERDVFHTRFTIPVRS